MKLHVREADASEFRVYERLVSFYFCELSGKLGWDVDSLGQFKAAYDLPKFWEEKGHHPLIINVDDATAGFILLRPSPTDAERREVAEFFVMPKYRRRGVGRAAATWLFNKVPGKWAARARHGITPVQSFWYKVTNEYAKGNVVHAVEEVDSPTGKTPMTFYHFATTADASGVPKPVPVAARSASAKVTTRPGLAA